MLGETSGRIIEGIVRKNFKRSCGEILGKKTKRVLQGFSLKHILGTPGISSWIL